jgi:hypothetical protein
MNPGLDPAADQAGKSPLFPSSKRFNRNKQRPEPGLFKETPVCLKLLIL